jgi:trehalose-6-phosphatase
MFSANSVHHQYQVLKKLAAIPGTEVVILSSRDRHSLETFLGYIRYSFQILFFWDYLSNGSLIFSFQ